MLTPALFAAVVVGVIGLLILWSNPARTVNRAVCVNSLCVAAWLACLHLATRTNADGLFWLRWACAAGALIPPGFWLVKESIVAKGERTTISSFGRQWGWMLVAVGWLCVIPFTDSFIPSHSTAAQPLRGWGYYGYMWVLLAVYGFMFYSAFRSGRKLTGARPLELQIWLGGGCAMIISVLITMALHALTNERFYIRIQPILVLVSYGAIAVAITIRRIFNARQILLLGTEKLLLVMSISIVAYVLYEGFDAFLPESFAFIATAALALWLAGILSGWLDRIFRFYPQATAARQAAFAVAARATRFENLEQSFLDLITGWGQCGHGFIFSGDKGLVRGHGVELAADSPPMKAMRQLCWATPERLAREKATPERDELGAFLKRHEIGVLVFTEGSALCTLVGAGIPASRRPFTYPQVTQLIEIAAIVEGALERAHFSAKAQRAEQLATVGLLGASMAHEIRNPLVTIKTFVQLLPNHYQDPVFRGKFFTLIGDEVTRIDRLTEQLLDLASPRAYTAKAIELHPVLRSSVELVAAKATDKRIQFITEFAATPDLVLTDASAAKQVLLNLCFNAIQAVEQQVGERWVKVSTRNLGQRLEMIVEDSGPGIAPEIRPRLFQPFQSTKSSGFGLGLAICSDILADLDATITVDPSVAGRGATFRIVFPCPA